MSVIDELGIDTAVTPVLLINAPDAVLAAAGQRKPRPAFASSIMTAEPTANILWWPERAQLTEATLSRLRWMLQIANGAGWLLYDPEDTDTVTGEELVEAIQLIGMRNGGSLPWRVETSRSMCASRAREHDPQPAGSARARTMAGPVHLVRLTAFALRRRTAPRGRQGGWAATSYRGLPGVRIRGAGGWRARRVRDWRRGRLRLLPSEGGWHQLRCGFACSCSLLCFRCDVASRFQHPVSAVGVADEGWHTCGMPSTALIFGWTPWNSV